MKFTTFGAPSPRNVTLRKHTVHGGLQVTNGTLTLSSAFFQKDLCRSPYWERLYRLQFATKVAIYKVSSSLFLRQY